jgi:hypothetical protein
LHPFSKHPRLSKPVETFLMNRNSVVLESI